MSDFFFSRIWVLPERKAGFWFAKVLSPRNLRSVAVYKFLRILQGPRFLENHEYSNNREIRPFLFMAFCVTR